MPGNLVEAYRAGMIATASPFTGFQRIPALRKLSNEDAATTKTNRARCMRGGLRQFEVLDSSEQRLVADTQPFGGARLVVFAILERRVYLPALDEPLCTRAYFGE